MKLNNGKGWEAISKHPSSHQYNQTTPEPRQLPPAQVPQVRQPSQGGGLTAGRLNAPYPPPPSPGKPMGPTRGDRPSATGAPPDRRLAAPTGGFPKPVSTPTASTQPQQQFQGSNPALQPAPRGQSTQVTTQQTQPRNSQTEPKKSFMQKLSSVFCCGTPKSRYSRMSRILLANIKPIYRLNFSSLNTFTCFYSSRNCLILPLLYPHGAFPFSTFLDTPCPLPQGGYFNDATTKTG